PFRATVYRAQADPQRRMAMETSRRNFLAAAAATVGTAATTPLALAADKFGRDRDWTGDTTVTYPEPAWEVRDKRFTGVQGNAPDDAAGHSDGSIWFTDPGYGILGPYEGHKAPFELPTRVYRIDPSGKTTVAAEGPMRRPNGICFSPDFKRCYVVDTGATDGPQYPANIIVFDVVSNGTALRGGKAFADFKPGFTDGIRCDTDGNVWCGWGWGGMVT